MLTTRGEYDNKKERLLYMFYSNAGMAPGPLELKACLEAFSDKLIDKLNKSEESMDVSKRAAVQELKSKIKSMQDIIRWIDSRDTRELNEGVMLNKTEAKFIADVLREHLKLLNDYYWGEIFDAFRRLESEERLRKRVRADTFGALRISID